MGIDMAPGSQRGRVLRPGDCVGIVAPSGPLSEERLAHGVAMLHAWGYRTAIGNAVLDRKGYLAGTDAARAADFNAMWARPDVDGVLCARGGYGAMRILEQIDWDLVRSQPKFCCGFSDITALHVAMEQKAGLITFHGPMVTALGAAEAYNGAHLHRAMESAEPLGEIPWPDRDANVPEEEFPQPLVLRPGVAEGRLAGGNLSLLCALMGTPWEPDLSGRVVLLEDVAEAPYRVDRMLQQLLLSGKLQRAAGILFGDSPSCMTGPPPGGADVTLIDVLRELLVPLGIPVLYGYPCGHTAYRATLPLGARVRLDAAAGRLTVLEPALI